MDGWMDRFTGGDDDRDGKEGRGGGGSKACKASRLEERTSRLLMVPGGGEYGKFHGEPQACSGQYYSVLLQEQTLDSS